MSLFIKANSKGFTLIELLVVLAVMGTLVGVFGFSFFGSGVALDSAQRDMLTWMRHARLIAISEGKESRLLVRSDVSDMDQFLRYVEVVCEGNSSEEWIVKKEGELLPDDVWILPEESALSEKMSFAEDWYSLAYSKWSGLPVSTSVAEGNDEEGENLTVRRVGSDNEFNYISFDSSGRVINNPVMVLSKGELRPTTDGTLTIHFPDKFQIKGILIQPYGGMLTLEHSDFSDI